MTKCIIMHKQDNVATVLGRVQAGEELMTTDTDFNETGRITARQEIPFGHKVALYSIQEDGSILKYGQVIGRAREDILAGDYVHVHNVVSIEGSVGKKEEV